MSSTGPDVSEMRQWTLLKQLHLSGDKKLGPFLKANGFPHDSTQKPWGKYYAHIRNKNMRITALPADSRLLFIEGQLVADGPAIADGPATAGPIETKQRPKQQPVDYIFTLSLEDKRKLLGVMRGLSEEEQDELLAILIRSKHLVNEGR